MPSPVNTFWNVIKYNNVDDKILDHPQVEHKIKQAEKFGLDLADKAIEVFKKAPKAPSGPTPTYQESVFIKPKKETTLYNVTNYEEKAPIVKKASKIFKNLSYHVQGLSLTASHQINNKSIGLVVGERLGAAYITKDGKAKNIYSATVNVGNKKVNLTYEYKHPGHSLKVSGFKQNSNIGITAKYKNDNGIKSGISVDRNSASAECLYNKTTEEYDLELGGFATTGLKHKNPLIGVKGRVSF